MRGKKNKKGKNRTQIGIVNSTDNFIQQVGIININDSQGANPDISTGNSGDSIGILNEPGAINYGTQIDIMNLD
ncbi:MAG: hypothetical protein F6K40_12315 [Okeania sp. SIO3I5]|uniref:hypothetical protein n=1 Tax=Okeania sp. SIO3I5 TaxID=2607805 RepID=UPI0013B5E3CC|nr:hypothetical protein [Okeania sp. SIO3I5]NEQ37014.1 hypothetical protein [Okeania sp. SIO3I5]